MHRSQAMNHETVHRPRKRGTAKLWLAFCVLAASSTLAAAAERSLDSVNHVSLPGGQIQITLGLSGPAPEPSAFTVDQPARLSLDLPGTELNVAERYRKIDIGATQAVAVAEGADRTRVVVELTRMLPYNIETTGNKVHIVLGEAATGAAEAEAEAEAERAQPAPAPAPQQAAEGTRIADIDFRRTETGAGRVRIRTEGLDGRVDISEEGGRIIARFPGTDLPRELARRLDVIDFATPVKYIDARERRDDAEITVTPLDDAEFDHAAYQTQGQFIIELQPLTRAEVEERERRDPKYTGDRISLSFQNVDVRALLQIIADVADVNMVVSDKVQGTMALRLEDVPWDQALDIILDAQGLGMQREGNVITVAPLADIAARREAQQEAQKATEQLAPLRSEIIQINYARASNFASLLKSGDVSLLSERGQVAVDERTNTLLISETASKLQEIRRLIDRLDIPVRQVLIESRIVVANREFSRDIGVSAEAQDQAVIGGGAVGGDKDVDSGFTVNLPVANAAGSISTSIIGSSFNLDLALSALETEQRGEIVSSPRVITANGKEARIDQGVEIPYLEAASSGAATVQFKEAVLSLTVTPQITPDDRVVMDLLVTQDTQGQSVNVQGGGQVPSINTRSLATQVLIDDGETVVLGGIYEQEDRDTYNQVPVLGDVPLLGALFRTTGKQRDKRELLLFITPKILKEGMTLRR